MNKILLLAINLIFLSGAIYAQPVLKPGIGVTQLPADGEVVCNIPLYLGSFFTSGLQRGDTAYDFTLYDLNGQSFNLASALNKGTPVLLVNGSYTCPVFRGKISDINKVISTYGNQLQVCVIYTVEAHPDKDISPYFGYVNTTSANTQAGILYRQPTTYGERKSVVQEMLNDVTLNAPVYIDGPCNNWWSTYGPAPNNAYLINTDGKVVTHEGWFNRFPDNVYCSIDSLLGTQSSNCTSGSGGNGNFTFTLISNDTIQGEVGETLSIDGELINNSNKDLQIYVRRITNTVPVGWASSLCMDVCYSAETDSTVILLPANATQSFHFYFYTSFDSAGTAYAKVGFKNLNKTSNSFMQDVYGITTAETTSAKEKSLSDKTSVFPNPAKEFLFLRNYPSQIKEMEIKDLVGKTVSLQSDFSSEVFIDIRKFPSGIYFIALKSDDGNISVKKFVKN